VITTHPHLPTSPGARYSTVLNVLSQSRFPQNFTGKWQPKEFSDLNGVMWCGTRTSDHSGDTRSSRCLPRCLPHLTNDGAGDDRGGGTGTHIHSCDNECAVKMAEHLVRNPTARQIHHDRVERSCASTQYRGNCGGLNIGARARPSQYMQSGMAWMGHGPQWFNVKGTAHSGQITPPLAGLLLHSEQQVSASPVGVEINQDTATAISCRAQGQPSRNDRGTDSPTAADDTHSNPT
jgi:hypothetical protein